MLIKKTAIGMIALASLWTLNAMAAANCPDAKEVVDHATKEGIGASWQTGDNLKWYLDYFSNNNKPAETAISKFTFMQAMLDNKQLTCYYEWPNEDGKSTNWMTLRLLTTDNIKASWNGTTCQNFEAHNCQFTVLTDGTTTSTNVPGQAPHATPTATTAPSSTTTTTPMKQ